MKVIAEKDSDTVFVEATKKELANICGYGCTTVCGCPDFQVGCKFDISPIFLQLQMLQGIGDKLEETQKRIHSVAEALSIDLPLIKEIQNTAVQLQNEDGEDDEI